MARTELEKAAQEVLNLSIEAGDPAHFRPVRIEGSAFIAALTRLRDALQPKE